MGKDALLPLPERLAEGGPEHILKGSRPKEPRAVSKAGGGGWGRPGLEIVRMLVMEIIPPDNDKSIKFGI